MKIQISVFSWVNTGQNDHSNPYIESTTVLFFYRDSASFESTRGGSLTLAPMISKYLPDVE